MNGESDCIFCKIVAGEVPCFELLNDEHTLAFMDINPANEGHCLVIPKVHVPDVYAISSTAIVAVARSARRVAAAVNAVLSPPGLNLIQANGPGAAQSVAHFHFHVLPRGRDDGLLLNWPMNAGDMKAIGELAERIRAAL